MTCVLAVPLLSVCAVGWDNVADPLVTTNDTVAPATGDPAEFDTWTTNDCASNEPTMADCPLPLSEVTDAGVTELMAVGPELSPPHADTVKSTIAAAIRRGVLIMDLRVGIVSG